MYYENSNSSQRNNIIRGQEFLVVVYDFEKLYANFLCTKVIIYTDQATIFYMKFRKESKPGFVLYVLRLQEFEFEVKDRNRKENQVSNILSPFESNN